MLVVNPSIAKQSFKFTLLVYVQHIVVVRIHTVIPNQDYTVEKHEYIANNYSIQSNDNAAIYMSA